MSDKPSAAEILIEPVCVYCNSAPWAKHGARCDPCAEKLIRAAVDAERKECERRAAWKATTIGIIRLYEDGEANEAARQIAAAIRVEPKEESERE